METILIGFDVRPLDPPGWDQQRRARFLYRRDAQFVLSVDPACATSLLGDRWERDVARPCPATPFVPELDAALAIPDCPARGARTVLAAGVVVASADTAPRREALEQSLGFWRAGLEAEPTYRGWPDGRLCLPDVPQPEWTQVGFDVADSSLTSALCNMGVTPARHPGIDTQLNRWHLFDALEPALAFRGRAEHDVPEHAPMLVYVLWWVEGP